MSPQSSYLWLDKSLNHFTTHPHVNSFSFLYILYSIIVSYHINYQNLTFSL